MSVNTFPLEVFDFGVSLSGIEYSKKKEGLFHMPTFFLMIIDDPGRALLDLRRDM